MAEQVPAIHVRAASREDVPAAADVLAEALAAADYPWTRWTVAADSHLSRLQSLFRLDLAEIAVTFGHVDVAEVDGQVCGAAAWVATDAPIPAAVWHRLDQTQAELAGNRAAAAEEAEALVRPHRPSGPFVLLATMAVAPGVQGRGVGGALLRHGLGRAGRARLPAYLETSTEDNVRFYRRYGFDVTADLRVPKGPNVWIMTRPFAAD